MLSDQPRSLTSDSFPLQQHELEFRVRYKETDGQGRVHHANYVNYFEIARVEMLRAAGYSYRLLEESGVFLVVSHVSCEYLQPAFYDDLLRIQTTVHRAKGVRIEHHYQIFRAESLLARGQSVIVSVDRSGKVRRLPPFLQRK